MAQAKRKPAAETKAAGKKTAARAPAAETKPKRAPRKTAAEVEAPQAAEPQAPEAAPLFRASNTKVRVPPRKVRLVVDMIRGKNVVTALGILDNTNKKAAPVVKALLRSAIANAEQKDQNTDVDALTVKEVYVDMGQTLKRFAPRAMGRAGRIRKRSSQITLKVG
jgi:large subunit ribosomal protein L22